MMLAGLLHALWPVLPPNVLIWIRYFLPGVADDKENARLIVSRIVLDGLNELKMACPKTTAKRRQELKSIRKLLTK
jgi:hypothetical protein